MSHWYVNYLIAPFLLFTAHRQNQEFVNGLPQWQLIVHDEDARHGISSADALVSETGDSVAIVSDEDAPFASSPSEYVAVICAEQSDLLETHDVEIRLPRP